MPKTIYMPVLKWKQGELFALEKLAPGVRSLTIPLLEFVDDTVDEDDDTTPAGAPFVKLSSQLKKAWGAAPVFVDAQELDGASPSSPHTMQNVFDAFRNAGVAAIPVCSPGASKAFCAAVAATIAQDRRGLAVRLSVDDFVSNFGATTSALVAALGAKPTDVDLVLDWGPIDPGAATTTYLSVAAVVPALPTLNAWRSVVFAASSFPTNLSAIGQGVGTILRAEWAAYQLLHNAPPGGRPCSFGDYAIAHPIYAPVKYLGSASIRYTIDDEWLIVRGRSLKGPVYGGFGQYVGLCKTLVQRPEYSGVGYSWGDGYIDACAKAAVSTGNATTWRKVGTNHHVTFVAQQLASHRGASNKNAPPPVGP